MAPAVTIVVLLTAAELAERYLRAIAAAREQPEAGVVGSRLLEPDGVSDGGWLVWDDGHTTQLNERNAPAVLAQTVPYPVDFCSGAATLIERAVWEQAGGFDERYFPAVYADADFCTAVWQLGRSVLHKPRSRVQLGRSVLHEPRSRVQLGRSVLHEPRSRVLHRTGAMVNERRGALGSPEFRRFLIWRQRPRYVEKWAAALADHGRRPAGVLPSDVAVAAADVERAALRTRRPSGAFVAAQRPLTADPARREARLLEAQVAIASEFADWLLAERHVETEAARDAHEAAARLWHERDELHVVLAGVTRERDEALARLSER